jgi:hypothetical protein
VVLILISALFPVVPILLMILVLSSPVIHSVQPVQVLQLLVLPVSLEHSCLVVLVLLVPLLARLDNTRAVFAPSLLTEFVLLVMKDVPRVMEEVTFAVAAVMVISSMWLLALSVETEVCSILVELELSLLVPPVVMLLLIPKPVLLVLMELLIPVLVDNTAMVLTVVVPV